MFKCLRNNIPCLPEAWVSWVLQHARRLLVLTLCVTGVLVFLTVRHFKINTDLTEMISNNLPFRRTVHEFHAAFPDLAGAIVLVVEGDNPAQLRQARNVLTERLRRETTLFKSVYAPGSGHFFDRNGLLYLSKRELEQQGDALAEMQPFLALLSQDFSLPGLFSVLGQMVGQPDMPLGDNEKIIRLFDKLGQTFSNVEAGKTQNLAWQDLMLEDPGLSQKKEFILLQPILNYRAMNPAKQAVNLIAKATAKLHLNEKYGVQVNITGKPVINYEDLVSVRRDITMASLLSLVMVGIILYLGLGSFRLVVAGLTTLLTGLAWTIAFAILLVGRLNMISVTFVVLFIGLGIDYSIQISLRYKELLASGRRHKKAIAEAVSTTSNTLLLCSISTAIGFYAFVPTAYIGASELGLISGTGMFFILLASITVLPALIGLMPEKKNHLLPLPIGKSVARLLTQYPRPIIAVATASALASTLLLPKVSFDANPFNMSDQRSKSIRTAMQLFQDKNAPPWTISVLASGRPEAEKLAARLRQVPEVRAVVTIDSFIPKDQEEKLEQIEDMALFLPDPPAQPANRPPDRVQRCTEALAELSRSLDERIDTDPPGTAASAAMSSLARNIHHFEKQLTDSGRDTLLLDRLDSALLPDLRTLLNRLHTLTEAIPVGLSQLPPDLVSRYVSGNTQYRVQVIPKNDLRDVNNLRRFVGAVTSIAPGATDQPVTVLAAGKTIVSAFRTASMLAFILIALVLRIAMKTWKDVLLVLIPLLLALCYTMAVAVLTHIPFNFANIIIVPLLLGIGVDSNLHVIHRVKNLRETNTHILQTSTARAVLFSSLTTVMSFGTLSFMHHAGTASMGKLLTLSVILMIFCTLIILPAYLERHNPYRKQ